jgi:hypothetical protein
MTTRVKKEEVVPQAQSLNIYQKLHCAKQSMGKVIKNATNPHFKRSYADINAILEAVEPILMDCGLILIQPVIDGKVISRIIDIETGDSIESSLELPGILDPQKLLSCITYYRRGTLVSLCSLQAIDDDGHEASRAPKAKPTLTPDRFNSALQAIQEGRYTVEDLRATYSLTKEQEGQLK